MLTALRKELNGRFAAWSLPRRPALRRAEEAEWLFCTDLPLLMDAEALTAALEALSLVGWRWERRGGWLWLDHPLQTPEDVPDIPLSEEAACLVSLLERHPDGPEEPALYRTLAKASEQGMLPWLKLCRALHRDWAVRLRLHQPLPGKAVPWIRAAEACILRKQRTR